METEQYWTGPADTGPKTQGATGQGHATKVWVWAASVS